MSRRSRFVLTSLAVASLGFGALAILPSPRALAGDAAKLSSDTAKGDIIDVATGPGMQEVTTLVTAVKAAGLVDTLKSPGPFTVFAPTNDAFKKLPAGTLDSLLKPENKEKLASVLTYHVVPGKYEASKVTQEKMLKTAQGGDLMIKEMNGKWMVGNDKGWATIIKTDVPASNGVIHWIDAVVMP